MNSGDVARAEKTNLDFSHNERPQITQIGQYHPRQRVGKGLNRL
jgi:hypothetical protein